MEKLKTIMIAACLLTAGSLAHADSVYFEDLFDGDDLQMDWVLLNPNPDGYLVEGGVLILLTPDGNPAAYDTAENILRLDKPIPKGDWTMTARFMFEPQTMGENFSIGVTKDGENSLLSAFSLHNKNYVTTTIYLESTKLSRAEKTNFSRNTLDISDGDIELRSIQFSDQISAVELRLQKDGRKYTSSVRLVSTQPGAEGAVDEEWRTVQSLTSLRSPGDAFTIIFGSNSNDYTPAGGESLIEIDWVKIEVNE